MLTEQEKEWLERRKNLCVRCIHKARGCTLGKTEGKKKCNFFDMYPDESDYRDAAEFEARVAALLAKDTRTGCLRPSGCFWYTKHKLRTQCPPGMDTYKCDKIRCSLYLARLKAEKEMGDWG